MAEEHHHAAGHEDHAQHLNPWLLGLAGVAGAVTLAPYALPAMGIGLDADVPGLMHSIGGMATANAAGAVNNFGTGWAGAVGAGISHAPLLGAWLTSAAPVTIPGLGWVVTTGALATLAVTAGVGIGGVLLGNWIEKHEAPNAKIHWGKIIRIASLCTSVLISLPGILSGVSVGIAFLAMVVGGFGLMHSTAFGLMNSSILGLQHTLGATAMTETAATGTATSGIFGAMLPHLLTCGSALFPFLGGMFLGHGKDAAHAQMSNENLGLRAELISVAPTERGQTYHLLFRLRDASGNVLTPQQLQTLHTQKIHTMLVDHSLTDYHHLHPIYNPATGMFACDFTPAMQQSYVMWNELQPNGIGSPITLRTELPHARGVEIPPMIPHAPTATAGGLTMQLSASPPLQAGRDSMVTLRISDAQGQVVTDLEPIMGAYAHLAGFSRDGQHYVHCHPLGAEPTSPAERGNGILQFHLHGDWAGDTKFFLQVQREGQIVTIPFGQRLLPPPSMVAALRSAEFSGRVPAHAR